MTTVLPVARDVTKAEAGVSPHDWTSPLRRRLLPTPVRTGGVRAAGVVALVDAAGASLVLVALSLATPDRSPADSMSVGLVALWLAALWVCGTYPSASFPVWPDQARRVTVAGLGLAALLPLVHGTTPPPGTAVTAALLVAATLLMRRTVPTISALRARTGVDTVRVVVSGHRRDVERIVTELEASRYPRYAVVGTCHAGPGPSGEFQDLSDTAAAASADAVLVAPCRHVSPAALRRLGWQLERSHTRLLLATSLVDVSPGRTRLAHAGPLPVVSVSHPPLDGTGQWIKEVSDRVLAALGLLLLAPVLVGVAVAICLDSPGAALFCQTRTGRNGVPFTMLKFRTMHCDAEQRRAELSELLTDDSILFKLRDDPRTTRVGRFLRRYSLDELPQLVNVLRGDMALVGPRPPLPEEVARYQPDVHRRLAVKPGITGLWQVSGRSDLSWEESVRLDLRYVDNWSLRADVGILARTLGAVLHHRGAY